MKKTSFLMTTLSIAYLGCGTSSKKTVEPEYVEQNLQGKFNEKAWEFKSARLVESSSTIDGEKKWRFTLINEEKEDICSEFLFESEDKRHVGFYLSQDQIKVQKIDLSISNSPDDGKTVTLYDYNEGENLNIIASSGFIEFTTIETGIVEAKMLAHFDENNSVTGSFKATKCCKEEGEGITNYIQCTE